MRSAEGLDACFALSTACPNADRGRAAAAPARAQVARNARRPVLDFFIAPPYLISKMYARPPSAGVGPGWTVPAGTNAALGVVDPSKINSTASPTWRCAGADDPAITTHAAARLFSQAGAPATRRKPSAGSAVAGRGAGGFTSISTARIGGSLAPSSTWVTLARLV